MVLLFVWFVLGRGVGLGSDGKVGCGGVYVVRDMCWCRCVWVSRNFSTMCKENVEDRIRCPWIS